jgi:hypothetical protein
MSLVDWRIEGKSFGNCNCCYACPCQFESDPTQGHCRGFEADASTTATSVIRGSTICALPSSMRGPADLPRRRRDAGDHRRTG